jgi:hypothetical protein
MYTLYIRSGSGEVGRGPFTVVHAAGKKLDLLSPAIPGKTPSPHDCFSSTKQSLWRFHCGTDREDGHNPTLCHPWS